MLQSIYTHAGCDYGCLYTYSPRHCFNPHTHAGCDNVHNVSGASFPVSIHTPTQGVTFLYICNVFRICFNPHTHAGCDPKCRTFMKPIIKFQSTHPRRVWLWKEGYERCWLRFQSTHPRRVWPHRGHTASSAVCFNPHTHAGCDGSERYKEIEALVSIHTPTQGVTLMLLLSVMWYLSVSIHTPTQGVTTISALFEGIINLFQSTHPRRVWQEWQVYSLL